MSVTQRKTNIFGRELVQLVTDMTGLHGELAMHMRNKLEAIKRADSDRIQSITARETTLAGRLAEREGMRRQMVERIASGLGLDAESHRTIKLTELAEYFVEPRRSQLLVAAAGLKEKVEEIEQLRVRTALITEEMLKHMKDVFSVMTSPEHETGVYSRTGGRAESAAPRVFEAVG